MCDVLKHFLCHLCAAGVIKINGLRSQSGKMCAYHIQVEHRLSCPPGEIMKVSLVVAVGEQPKDFFFFHLLLGALEGYIAVRLYKLHRISESSLVEDVDMSESVDIPE